LDDIQFVTAKINVHLESHRYIIRHLVVPHNVQKSKDARRDKEGAGGFQLCQSSPLPFSLATTPSLFTKLVS